MSSGKRTADEAGIVDGTMYNTSGKAMFVRNQDGDLVTVLPGQVMPAKMRAATEDAQAAVALASEKAEEARLANRSEEDKQYEAYLAGKDNKRGNVWIANAGQASTDRAMFADSISAQVAEERAKNGGPEYRPAAAHAHSPSLSHAAPPQSPGPLHPSTSLKLATKPSLSSAPSAAAL